MTCYHVDSDYNWPGSAELQKQGATHVYVTISGQMTQKRFSSVSPEDGVAEEELFKIFGFREDDLLDQRVGFNSLKTLLLQTNRSCPEPRTPCWEDFSCRAKKIQRP